MRHESTKNVSSFLSVVDHGTKRVNSCHVMQQDNFSVFAFFSFQPVSETN